MKKQIKINVKKRKKYVEQQPIKIIIKDTLE